VVRLEPANFEAQLDLGICYAQKGFYAEAERAYEKARAINAEDLLLNYNLSALYALWGRPKDAVTFLQKALSVDKQKVMGWLSTDPMFDALKGDPEFDALF
jgi:Flp pilus assembly protein TadD